MAHTDSTHSVQTIDRQIECKRTRQTKDRERYLADVAFRRLLQRNEQNHGGC